ncbi:hypothetical protein [Pseudonocardia kunmingensis]|uniref:hypothetical protein n=1 Tax=Pseudonocardia kunmingensis TaxID=630975 RepID=UPI0011543844|nr:hypothetical protein [Pseudonocardia kunmingensis]
MATDRLALVLHPHRDATDVVRTVVRWARAHDAEVLARAEDATRAGADVRAVEAAELAATCDTVVTVGGDGTLAVEIDGSPVRDAGPGDSWTCRCSRTPASSSASTRRPTSNAAA